MKHPGGTPMTPAEWAAERLWRWERLNRQQRSRHPVSQGFLPLFKRYADGNLGNLSELIEAMQHHGEHSVSQRPNGPDGFEPSATPSGTGAGSG